MEVTEEEDEILVFDWRNAGVPVVVNKKASPRRRVQPPPAPLPPMISTCFELGSPLYHHDLKHQSSPTQTIGVFGCSTEYRPTEAFPRVPPPPPVFGNSNGNHEKGSVGVAQTDEWMEDDWEDIEEIDYSSALNKTTGVEERRTDCTEPIEENKEADNGKASSFTPASVPKSSVSLKDILPELGKQAVGFFESAKADDNVKASPFDATSVPKSSLPINDVFSSGKESKMSFRSAKAKVDEASRLSRKRTRAESDRMDDLEGLLGKVKHRVSARSYARPTKKYTVGGTAKSPDNKPGLPDPHLHQLSSPHDPNNGPKVPSGVSRIDGEAGVTCNSMDTGSSSDHIQDSDTLNNSGASELLDDRPEETVIKIRTDIFDDGEEDDQLSEEEVEVC